MITFRIKGKSATGKLEGQRFTVSGEPITESLLNEIAKAVPVANGGSPDPDYDLFQNVVKKWPFLEIVSHEEPPVRVKGRIY